MPTLDLDLEGLRIIRRSFVVPALYGSEWCDCADATVWLPRLSLNLSAAFTFKKEALKLTELALFKDARDAVNWHGRGMLRRSSHTSSRDQSDILCCRGATNQAGVRNAAQSRVNCAWSLFSGASEEDRPFVSEIRLELSAIGACEPTMKSTGSNGG